MLKAIVSPTPRNLEGILVAQAWQAVRVGDFLEVDLPEVTRTGGDGDMVIYLLPEPLVGRSDLSLSLVLSEQVQILDGKRAVTVVGDSMGNPLKPRFVLGDKTTQGFFQTYSGAVTAKVTLLEAEVGNTEAMTRVLVTAHHVHSENNLAYVTPTYPFSGIPTALPMALNNFSELIAAGVRKLHCQDCIHVHYRGMS